VNPKRITFRKWLEDTGEVRVALVTNEPLGIPSKYTQSKKWNKTCKKSNKR
jgi:hypothetical protein